jgi:hypothetical protein
VDVAIVVGSMKIVYQIHIVLTQCVKHLLIGILVVIVIGVGIVFAFLDVWLRGDFVHQTIPGIM